MRGRLVIMVAAAILTGAARSPAAVKGALPEMVTLPAATFMMGAPPDADVQQGKPRHPVHLSAFRIARTDVTFEEYDRFARATGRALPQDEGAGRGARPVINVTRADMLAYIAWLNRTSGERGFRLPSEAEWEYAARGGTTTRYYWGDQPDPRRVNSAVNTPPDIYPLTSPVKSFPPNRFGLYDMSGNVWQEVADCVHPTYDGAPSDGRPWMGKGCFSYVLRGGSFQIPRRGLTTTARAGVGGTFASPSVGFRVAQDAPR